MTGEFLVCMTINGVLVRPYLQEKDIKRGYPNAMLEFISKVEKDFKKRLGKAITNPKECEEMAKEVSDRLTKELSEENGQLQLRNAGKQLIDKVLTFGGHIGIISGFSMDIVTAVRGVLLQKYPEWDQDRIFIVDAVGRRHNETLKYIKKAQEKCQVKDEDTYLISYTESDIEEVKKAEKAILTYKAVKGVWFTDVEDWVEKKGSLPVSVDSYQLPCLKQEVKQEAASQDGDKSCAKVNGNDQGATANVALNDEVTDDALADWVEAFGIDEDWGASLIGNEAQGAS